MQDMDAEYNAELNRRLDWLAANMKDIATGRVTSYDAENQPTNRQRLSAYEGSDISSENQQPNQLLRFLALLLRSLQRRDLFNFNDLKNLRLVNVETRCFVDEVAPLTKFIIGATDLQAFINFKGISKKLKSLNVDVSRSKSDNETLGLLFVLLPRMESLTVDLASYYGSMLCLHGPPAWPALTSLELRNDFYAAKTLSALANAPLKALKKLHYSHNEFRVNTNSMPVEPEVLAAALSNLQGLTFLDLAIRGISNKWTAFKEDDLHNLEVARLYIRSANKAF